jgi:hypothetical protein
MNISLLIYVKRLGQSRHNCFPLYESVTSTTPGLCRDGVCTRIAPGVRIYKIMNLFYSKKKKKFFHHTSL